MLMTKYGYEIIHYFSDRIFIASKANKIFYKTESETGEVILPVKLFFVFANAVRLLRRLFRLDKCNVYPSNYGLIIVKDGKVYYYDFRDKQLIQTLQLKNCRNSLHQSFARNEKGYIYFGEYGSNPNRTTVPVYRSIDEGKSWQIIYEFKPGETRHVHACYYDKFTKKIWVCTGDFKQENKILIANDDFTDVQIIGDGSQMYRTCHFIFTENEVHWMMDSQLETSSHIIYNRSSKTVKRNYDFLGPVWYMKQSTNDFFVGTTQERGPGVKDEFAHLMHSKDLKTWKSIYQFKHDGFPKKYFKDGIIGFSDGVRVSDETFYLFFEAIKGFDGNAIKFDAKKLQFS